MHPTTFELLAKDKQRDRLAQAAHSRLVREAREHHGGEAGNRRSTARALDSLLLLRLQRLLAAVVAAVEQEGAR